jgi:TolB-like protein/Tfp pilus assembly protein PilF
MDVTDTPTEREGEGAWTKVRRRKVVQWGFTYAAAAWGLLQGLGYVSGLYDWPRQYQQIAMLLLVIGLPIVIVLAWYHGDKGEQRVGRAELAILTVMFLLGGGLFWRYQHATNATSVTAQVATSPSVSAGAIPTDHSIAVLPFVNMSSDKEQEYFADGISEELLNLLAQVPQLRVIARTSSFSFKGKEVDVATIARTLNVANVLEGSVRKSGETLRITAQLIRASDSSHLWSETYDRQMTDVFKVQDEIAAEVVNELKIKLLGNAPKARVTDPKAYALYLQARAVTRQYNAAALDRAASLYKQALTIDPTYAPAWDGLAEAYFYQIDQGELTCDAGRPRVGEAIGRALTIDPDYAPTYARAALVATVVENDLSSAALQVEKGLALDPANLDVINAAGRIAQRMGRSDQSIKLAEYLVTRDPVNVVSREYLGMDYANVGRFDDAIAELRTALALSPDSSGIHEELGEVLLQKGDVEAALVEMKKEPSEQWRLVGLALANHALDRKAEADSALNDLIGKYEHTMSYNIAYVLAYRGETDRAFEWLDKAAEYHDSGLGSLAIYQLFASLHSDPRWLPLLRKLGMAPEQLAAIKFDVSLPQ